MIFLTLRNNRKLAHSISENFRKVFFGSIIAGISLLLILSLEIDVDQFKTIYTSYDIHYMSSLVITIISIPLTMFILLAMNKNEYGQKIFKYLFEMTYMLSGITIATIFYLHLISLLMVQVWFLVASVVITFLSFTFSRFHINYKATTMFGSLVVKPLSFDNKMTGVLGFVYLIIAFILQGAGAVFFNYVDIHTTNYLAYQFIITLFSSIFYILCIAIFSKSRSIGQSQEVLYYRYAQLILISLIVLIIGLGIYRIFVKVESISEITDKVSMIINVLPITVLFIDLWINKKRANKNRLYQGITEFRLLIKIFSAVIFVLINTVIATEIKFFTTGETQESIDVTLVAIGSISLIVALPFFVFWKKITKRSSRLLNTLLIVLFSFALYKFYFYADITNLDVKVFGIPVDSIYTMVALFGLILVQIVTIVYQARNSAIAYKRYGAQNTMTRKGKK